MNHNRNLAGVVLAGGESRRMGVDKAQLPFGSQTMFGQIVRQLQLICPAGIWVVAAADATPREGFRENVSWIADRIKGRGPLEGFAVAMQAVLKYPLAVVTSCDMPFINAPLITAMVDRLTCGNADAVVIDDGQQVHPLGAVYKTCLHAVAQRRIDQGRMSLHGLLAEIKVDYVDRRFVERFDPELRSLLNINTPENYEVAMQIMASRRDSQS